MFGGDLLFNQIDIADGQSGREKQRHNHGYDGLRSLSRIDRRGYSELKRVIYKCREKVVRTRDRMNITGEVEIGLGDGSVHRFGPGHVTLAEDLTGQGHTTRVVGDQPRVTATIPIDAA